ncbi:hypothetical protein JDBNIEOD_01426 [Streptococcus equi subsp. zooepidemicus]|jgi:hypothetical protein|uniref:hypothetical protein n=1 Tax=Streptococcus equi TaxID=1336 RepID=UPI001BEF1890|nr:hypothetical protein [Streptococcus equi]MDU0945879.1 hypothetical protein [Anaerococcus vaginalis]QUQ78390.1 hypothetical protein JDBNIEOD_01426 [Streptococcus equi subsp. zooepidemicus]
MNQNIIEYARELSIKKLFETNGFSTVWPTWKNKIQTDIFNSAPPTEHLIYSIGDNLRDIFRTTGQAGRSQSDVSGGGANWEALVCWYLNICLIDRRTFVLKHNKDLIPSPIKDAITVNYGNFRSNTESDLIAITFPDKAEYTIDKEQILIKDIHGNSVDISKGKNYNFLPILDALVARDFDDIEIHIIQCKTNWNDNAQIPMLWDAVYSANTFRNGISVGTNGYSIHDAKRFTYSFVTVPSNQIEKNGRLTYKNTSTAVLRVLNLSGGNYWGLPSETGVASSIKELLERNLKSGHSNGIISTIRTSMSYLNSTYSYFDII